MNDLVAKETLFPLQQKYSQIFCILRSGEVHITLGKRKSINYLVAMETLLPCYSPGDVLICCVCSLGQNISEIRKSPRSSLYGGNLSLSIVIQISLESSNFSPDFVLYTLHSTTA